MPQAIYYAVIKFRLDEKELQRKVFRAATGKLFIIGHLISEHVVMFTFCLLRLLCVSLKTSSS